MNELSQRDGEAPAEWLARLRQLDPSTLTDHQRFFVLQHALDSARVAVRRQEDDASYALASRIKEPLPGADNGTGASIPTRRQAVEETALEVCKNAFRALNQEDRERFSRWLADAGT
jgi:hypothetical protein